MHSLHHVAPLRTLVAEWRRAGLRVALVPTMGNLHRGHLVLVREALARADRVVTSVFVNPLQFGPAEDFESYPRTLQRDAALLGDAGNHVLFAPSESEVYPNGRAGCTTVDLPGLSEELCGASRPGHFRGVATVVAKLFNMVQPDLAIFGEKDFQQLLVIRRMTADLNLPVDIVGVPTVREADGLALSSRNGYLTPDERAVAPRLYQTLRQAAAALQHGRTPDDVERDALRALTAAGFVPDYVSVRRRADLAPVDGGKAADGELVVLAAARLGAARLIDNLGADVAGAGT
jgi:pantoate--beta-alanine ligase